MLKAAARAAMLVLMLAAASAARAADAKGPAILTADVDRFFQIYDAAGGQPTAEQLDRDYLAQGSPGLRHFAQLRRVTGARMAETLQKQPQIYVDARRCLAVLPGVKRRLAVAFGKLARAYPEARFPPVTLVIGRGRPVGITDPAGVSMGVEALCAATFMNPDLEARFVHTIAHEYGHIQQPDDTQALEVGMPGATLLRMSLIEGAAEFAAELISGDVGNHQHHAWTRGRELEIETAFVADQDATDLSKWLNNGPGTADAPGDLGYWVGYRIVKAYYAQAADKHQALREIFDIRDAKAFLARSGWRPGG
jgi:hypothetical protein